ncbi:hypothetical protein UCMB321_4785 [Pseudomonas batumici]|uniref:Uncharacterized protein n=1 Tax=Pseudomonas batumici TaxID=226910 RepID=A0A0C2ES94_9PSED|nr:hypothetical protein UCMB321_4785 [Pseudomonas batumici]
MLVDAVAVPGDGSRALVAEGPGPAGELPAVAEPEPGDVADCFADAPHCLPDALRSDAHPRVSDSHHPGFLPALAHRHSYRANQHLPDARCAISFHSSLRFRA